MKKLNSLIIIAIAAFIIVSCKKEITPTISPTAFGIIEGKVTAPNPGKYISNALVFVDLDGEIFFSYADTEGNFELDVPAGKHMLHIQSGDGQMFRTVKEVDVISNERTSANDPGNSSVQLNQVANLAYITGSYDNIEAIIIDSLGYNATEITTTDLEDIATMSQYDAIFLNCHPVSLSTNAYTNLDTYVSDGGSLYASDWASDYLLGSGSGCAKPGGFIDDNTICMSRSGSIGWVNGASIVASDIQQYLGKNSIDVEYDLGGWDMIVNVDQSFWEVLVSDPNLGPLMVRTSAHNSNTGGTTGGGTSGSGNGNNAGWVTICHIPPGNPNNPITITISVNALAAHQAHGDPIGPCNPNAGGTIYYTTFHNHHQVGLAPDIKDVLEYVVLNL